ncbi:insulin-like growth factor-binding protein-related protein 1 isoform X1 [Cherax quadricarinatus]|uniref:insulin-like growth factor-binding protein-related protein 1 isoform X1 n=1 Tax=Cherax quadricarinatus TaxID=27406 RepID=UPI00387E80D8
MARTVVYAVSAALLVAVAASQSIVTCGECDRSKCAVTASCPGGVVLDTCGCCEVCARGLGQLCENTTTEDTPTTTHYGVCGQYLVCRTRTDTGGTGEATCECEDSGAVCGSDGVTYTTLCHLLMETAERPDLSVAVRGPCKTAPVIKSKPEDKIRPLGSILVLDCEAVGYPVPDITWELNRPDGSSFKLPGDDSSFAVQVRGGPEPYMITGWVQIMRVTNENLGIYNCVATNSEGEARASVSLATEKLDISPSSGTINTN